MVYGLETLSQLIKFDFSREQYYLPAACDIADAPRFPHRGLLIDSGRHFLPTSFIKKQVTVLRAHKMNVLHWHLTEDQAWPV